MAEIDEFMYEIQVVGLKHLNYFRHTLRLEYEFNRTYNISTCIEPDSDTSSLAIF